MQFFNQFSFLLLGVIAVAFTGAVLRLLGLRVRAIFPLMAVVALLFIAAILFLRPTSDVNSLSEAEALLTNGKPTFVEFFSLYCAGCLAARPGVDALVSRISSDFNILRVDVHSDFGRTLRERYDFSFTPEFVMFDANGEEVWRGHALPTADELSLARN